MSDIIRLARNIYGPAEYGRLADKAGQTKAEYVAAGGRMEDVYSPERVSALANGGPLALLRDEGRLRADGSIAAPYVPTELALATNLIEPAALPAVLAAMRNGIDTASSGTDPDTGKGFAIGRDPNGQVVKLIR
jgi:hypothetical protein